MAQHVNPLFLSQEDVSGGMKSDLDTNNAGQSAENSAESMIQTNTNDHVEAVSDNSIGQPNTNAVTASQNAAGSAGSTDGSMGQGNTNHVVDSGYADCWLYFQKISFFMRFFDQILNQQADEYE